MKIIVQRDFWAGLLFLGFGLFFLTFGLNYKIGSAMRMGPAYFPVLLSSLLIMIGLIVAGRSVFKTDNPVPAFALRPLTILIVAICLFGFLLRPLGLVIATAVLVVVGGRAGPEFRLLGSLALAIMLTAFSVLIFVYVLGLPFTLWPEL